MEEKAPDADEAVLPATAAAGGSIRAVSPAAAIAAAEAAQRPAEEGEIGVSNR